MILLNTAKLLLIAVSVAVVWAFLSNAQISLALATICITIISLLTA